MADKLLVPDNMKSAICSPSPATGHLPGLDKAAIVHITAIEAASLPACRDLAAKVAIGLPRAWEAAAQTHSDVGAGAEMLKLALSREHHPRGRLQHKPIAAAESRQILRNPIITDSAAQTHSFFGISNCGSAGAETTRSRGLLAARAGGTNP